MYYEKNITDYFRIIIHDNNCFLDGNGDKTSHGDDRLSQSRSYIIS
jgi:hypothetical protein